MGKSHIGLTYSQEINEILDKLANMVNTCPFIQLIQLVTLILDGFLKRTMWFDSIYGLINEGSVGLLPVVSKY